MSELLHDLVNIKNKLETYKKRSTEELLKYMDRLSRLQITKESIRNSKINEIIRIMSKNSGSAFDPRLSKRALTIREAWKQHFKKGKSKPVVKSERAEQNRKTFTDPVKPHREVQKRESSKIQEEVSETRQSSKNVDISKKNLVLGENIRQNIDLEDDGTVYGNEFLKYYQELDDKKRLKCFQMLVKIFQESKDVIARVYRDRIGLKQPAFSDQMDFVYSDFFKRFHRDHLLIKNKR